MAYRVIVVGIGPGAPDYLIPAAKREIDRAKVLVGSKRALATYAGHCASVVRSQQSEPGAYAVKQQFARPFIGTPR